MTFKEELEGLIAPTIDKYLTNIEKDPAVLYSDDFNNLKEDLADKIIELIRTKLL